jgi:HPt (histidine-containing phosphotransfer) domain-containing protein
VSADENPFGELLQDYVVECLPLAEQVADVFVELERRWRGDDPADDLLDSVAGRLHTVKGNSAMMGLAPMQDVAHALEDACAGLRRSPGRRTDDAAVLLIEGATRQSPRPSSRGSAIGWTPRPPPWSRPRPNVGGPSGGAAPARTATWPPASCGWISGGWTRCSRCWARG